MNIPDQGVDLEGVNVVQLLQGSLDLGLVGLDIDDEDEGVVLLNLLHGRLGVERVDDDLVLVQAGLVVDGLAGVLGVASQTQGLGLAEGGRGPDLGLLVGVNLKNRDKSGQRLILHVALKTRGRKLLANGVSHLHPSERT